MGDACSQPQSPLPEAGPGSSWGPRGARWAGGRTVDRGDSSPAREGKPGAVASPRPDSIRCWSTARRTLPGVRR